MRSRWYAPGSVHQIVFNFLRDYCQHPDLLANFAQRYKEKNRNDDVNPMALRAGLITKSQLVIYIGDTSGGGGFAVGNELARIFDALIYWDVFTEFPLSERGLMIDFRINFSNVAYYEERKVLENIVKGPGILHLRYYPATVAIIVDKKGLESIGSGSVVSHNGKTFLLTNRHVVDPSDGIAIKSVLLADEPRTGPFPQPILSETDDLAALPFSVPEMHPRFYLGHEAFPLQEVILFGYPKIPLSTRPHLTVHSGEINAKIQIRGDEELFLISNYASPGSSGGPLIDYRGLLIGVVSDSLEAHYEGDASIFQHSAAVSLDRVQQFIQSRVLPEL
jgi:Trypsin-like peptidase domain